MKIKISEFVDGARNAKGIAVIIDVFRAFSSACYAFDSGAIKVVATNNIEKAFELKKSFRNIVLAGERDERKIPGFELGNSPTEIIKYDLKGKTMILTTTAGTNGLLNAKNAEMVITGSLVNATAVVKYVRSMHPRNVTLVAMGYRSTVSADEDMLCAKIIESGLRGDDIKFNDMVEGLRNSSGKRFFDPANIDFSPPTDFFLCTMIDRFDFVLKCEHRPDGNIELIKIDM
ncbi:MAG: 2-phosphosulfolactate phosphatase [Bacteroidales bacterium]|jgi:2-phosphosulfolactate phosphatase